MQGRLLSPRALHKQVPRWADLPGPGPPPETVTWAWAWRPPSRPQQPGATGRLAVTGACADCRLPRACWPAARRRGRLDARGTGKRPEADGPHNWRHVSGICSTTQFSFKRIKINMFT